MNEQVAILGYSIAGASAAHELRALGLRPFILDLLEDSQLSVRASVRGGDGRDVTGEEFERTLRASLKASDVSIDSCSLATAATAGAEILLQPDASPAQALTAASVIVAPNGSTLLGQPIALSGIGWSLFTNADDASAFRGRRVCVIGSDNWAREQALVAADRGAIVIAVGAPPPSDLGRIETINGLVVGFHTEGGMLQSVAVLTCPPALVRL